MSSKLATVCCATKVAHLSLNVAKHLPFRLLSACWASCNVLASSALPESIYKDQPLFRCSSLKILDMDRVHLTIRVTWNQVRKLQVHVIPSIQFPVRLTPVGNDGVNGSNSLLLFFLCDSHCLSNLP